MTDSDDSPLDDLSVRILSLLEQHDIPLRTKAIYGGVLHAKGVEHSYRTYQARMATLLEGGYVKRVQIDTDTAEIKPLSHDNRRGYYLLTDAGRTVLESVRF